MTHNDDTMDRIKADGDYLIIARKPNASGYYHSLTERAYLVENIMSFMHTHPDVEKHAITIYELREVNLKREDF